MSSLQDRGTVTGPDNFIGQAIRSLQDRGTDTGPDNFIGQAILSCAVDFIGPDITMHQAPQQKKKAGHEQMSTHWSGLSFCTGLGHGGSEP